jgi:chromosome segregation ATPase
MAWWLWLIIVVGVYLVACVVPWAALQIMAAILGKKGSFVSVVFPRISRLVDTERVQSGLWPEAPRSGRYEAIDRAAQRLLVGLRAGLSQINQEADDVAAYAPPELSLWRVLALGAWLPMISASRALRERRNLDRHLDGAEGTAAALLEQQSVAEGVPDRMQAELADVRAEVRRLYVLWEAEVDAGTKDIEAIGDGLALVDNSLGSATESIKASAADDELATILRADEQLSMATETIRQTERDLGAIRDSRIGATQAVIRARATIGDVSARWDQLKSRGAQDPSVAARIVELAQQGLSLDGTLEQATPQAYSQAVVQAQDVASLGTTISGELQALDEAMERSSEAVSANAVLLEKAESMIAESSAAMPDLALDESTAAITEAQEVVAQSQALLAQGTWHGYQTASTLAEQAREGLEAALAGISSTRKAVQALGLQREQVNPGIRSALRERAAALALGWAAYGRHWHPLRQESLAGALQHLDAADAAWSALPEGYLDTGALEQSRLADVQASMQTVADEYRQASQEIESLAEELSRVMSLREQLESGLASLERDTLPSLEACRDTMLPELAERYDAWLSGYHAERATLSDPAQIDYERAAGEWLPTAVGEAKSILAAYDGDLAHYGKLLGESTRQLEKSWQRLQRLNPTQVPLPEEDIHQLLADYDLWMATAEAEANNSAVLSTLVTHQAGDLERRIETARRQVSEGRQTLASLERQFDQLGQSLQKTRASLRSMEQGSQWQQIDWVLGSGEESWERALAAQASSQEAESLDMAVNELQRALNVGQEAQQIYVGTEQQLRSALDRLNREFRAATAELDRAQRRAGQLRQQGPSEEVDALDERIASAMSLVSMAQNAATFEDALRHLRASQEELGRA